MITLAALRQAGKNSDGSARRKRQLRDWPDFMGHPLIRSRLVNDYQKFMAGCKGAPPVYQSTTDLKLFQRMNEGFNDMVQDSLDEFADWNDEVMADLGKEV